MSRFSTIVCFLALLIFSGAADAASVVKAACTAQSTSVVTWGTDHKTKTTTVTACSGAVTKTVATIQPTSAVTWAADHITKTTTLTFGDGAITRTVATVQPTTAVTWATDHITKTTALTYGDGTVTRSVTTVQPISAITWAADHITKTTTVTYGDGKSTSSTATVPGTVGTPTYAAGVETKVTTYGDGTTATATFNATKTAVTWASDHVTKTTTYTFADTTTNPVVTTVPGKVTSPTLTLAHYPSNWSTTGTVSPPNVSSISTAYGDGTTITNENGSSIKPFNQVTLSAASIADPNSYVSNNGKLYDLRWGVPDIAGPQTANESNVTLTGTTQQTTLYYYSAYRGNTGSINLPNSQSSAVQTGQSTNALQGVWITADVRNAWNKGWTGSGIKVGVFDDFTANDKSEFFNTNLANACYNYLNVSFCTQSRSYVIPFTHGNQVAMIIGGSLTSALAAYTETGTFLTYSYGGDYGNYSYITPISVSISSPIYGVAKGATILRNDFLSYQSNTNGIFSVFQNLSAGSDSASKLFQSLKVVNMSFANTSTNSSANTSTYNSNLSYANNSLVPDIVFVKAAGNSGCIVSLTNCDPTNAVLHDSNKYKNQTILVGALTQAGGSIASYSNLAGGYSDIFLVADGRGILMTNGGYDQGTSFAAPRVSGYAAIVRQKFPNLTGSDTASILLSTARYDTLSCYPNCDKSIYGQGEASLSRALAPVGYLR